MKRTADRPNPREALTFEYELDASPAQVWRALTVPEFVAQWLAPVPKAPATTAPTPDGASFRLLDCEPDRSVRYVCRENESPFLESIVTFRLTENDAGGTTFVIDHQLAPIVMAGRRRPAANSNAPPLLLAA